MVNYPKLEQEAREESKKLQENATKIQEELKEVIKQNYATTKIHYIVMGVLTAIIALSALIPKAGRYAITSATQESLYVLDTKTSQLWLRSVAGNICLGTNENPRLENNLLKKN